MTESEFQQRQGEIYNALASAVLESLPEEWVVAQLRLGRLSTNGDIESMRHELVNPTLERGLTTATPSDEVYASSHRLASLFREYGRPWSKATFEVAWDDEAEQWRFAMDFEYDQG